MSPKDTQKPRRSANVYPTYSKHKLIYYIIYIHADHINTHTHAYTYTYTRTYVHPPTRTYARVQTKSERSAQPPGSTSHSGGGVHEARGVILVNTSKDSEARVRGSQVIFSIIVGSSNANT